MSQDRQYSIDALKRLPQKLFLQERDHPPWMPRLIAGMALGSAVAWWGVSTAQGWGTAAALIGAGTAMLVGYAGWLVITCVVIPVLQAKG